MASDVQGTNSKKYSIDILPRILNHMGVVQEIKAYQEGHPNLGRQPQQPRPSPMKFLSWNVRGAGSAAFRNHHLQQIDTHKPSIVFLVETRISGEVAANMCASLPS